MTDQALPDVDIETQGNTEHDSDAPTSKETQNTKAKPKPNKSMGKTIIVAIIGMLVIIALAVIGWLFFAQKISNTSTPEADTTQTTQSLMQDLGFTPQQQTQYPVNTTETLNTSEIEIQEETNEVTPEALTPLDEIETQSEPDLEPTLEHTDIINLLNQIKNEQDAKLDSILNQQLTLTEQLNQLQGQLEQLKQHSNTDISKQIQNLEKKINSKLDQLKTLSTAPKKASKEPKTTPPRARLIGVDLFQNTPVAMIEHKNLLISIRHGQIIENWRVAKVDYSTQVVTFNHTKTNEKYTLSVH